MSAANPFRCANCGSSLPVSFTRHRADATRRVRVCTKCGFRLETRETAVQASPQTAIVTTSQPVLRT
jgi:hypothetical protein